MNQKIRFALVVPMAAPLLRPLAGDASIRAHALAALADPRIVLGLLGAGILGICWEFALTGGVVPGVVGSVCLLVSLSSFPAAGLDPYGLVLLAVSFGLLALEARWRARGALALAGTAAGFAGLRVADPSIPAPAAILASALFAVPIAVVLSIAAAARRNKLVILKAGLKKG